MDRTNNLLVAVFAVFLLGLIFTVFVPNVTATATLQQQADGVPLVLLWALPVLAIVAVAMFFSYKAICSGKKAD